MGSSAKTFLLIFSPTVLKEGCEWLCGVERGMRGTSFYRFLVIYRVFTVFYPCTGICVFGFYDFSAFLGLYRYCVG